MILFDCGNGGLSRWLVPALRADRIGYHFLAQEQVFQRSFAELLHWLGVSPRKCATSEKCPCQGATPTVTSKYPWSGGGGGTLRTGAYAVLTIFIGGSGCAGSPTQIYRLEPIKKYLTLASPVRVVDHDIYIAGTRCHLLGHTGCSTYYSGVSPNRA